MAILVLAVVGSTPTSSIASEDEETIFDPGTGILSEAPEDRARDLLEMNAIGVDTIRVVAQWRSFAPDPTSPSEPRNFDPTDPTAYPDGAFASLDQVVRGADILGMDILLTPSAPIPDWASGTRDSTVNEPDPTGYQQFVEALGHRYSGTFVKDSIRIPGCPLLLCPPAHDEGPLPRVHYWALWNEPNIGIFLGPQFKDGRPYSPILYRRLYLAGQDGLADSGHRSDRILLGETATSGGRTGINPLDFLRGVLCMDARFGPSHPCEPLQATGFAHHPYGYSTPPQLSAPNRGLIDLATMPRLDHLLDRAYEIGATSTPLDVYITEFGVLSDPHPAGFPLPSQASFMAAAEFLAWRDPQVAAFGQYLLRDDPPENRIVFTTGLRFSDNTPKPLRRAFPVTMLVRHVSRGSVAIWGHVRPARGKVGVEVFTRRRDGSPSYLRSVRTDENGYFRFSSPFHPETRWQVRADLPDGRTLSGPFIGAIRFPLPRL